MIKEKEVEINIVPRTVKKYQLLGYDCKIGDSILIDIKDINKNSKVKITAICDICKVEKMLPFYAHNKGFNKYGYYCCNNCKQVKIEKTNFEKYGVKRPIQNKDIRDKLESTNLEKYGYKIASKNKTVINKLISTNLEKYGETSSSKNLNVKIKHRNTIIKNLLEKYNYLNIQSINNNICEFFCDKGHLYYISFTNLNNRISQKTTICTICNPIGSGKSGKELQLLNFIKENYNDNIIENDRKILNGKEIDILLPNIGIGFEFNGDYWHSKKFKKDGYHFGKIRNAYKKNIKLYNIWEYKWDNNRKEIENKIIKLLKLKN